MPRLHLHGASTGTRQQSGDPHFGSHAWPSLCSAIIAVVHDIEVEPILNDLHAMDIDREQLGLRAFVWNIERASDNALKHEMNIDDNSGI